MAYASPKSSLGSRDRQPCHDPGEGNIWGVSPLIRSIFRLYWGCSYVCSNVAPTSWSARCVLGRVSKESRTDVPDLQHITLLSSRLTPFFMIVHPIRGQVLGPFTKIPASALHVRYLALDLCGLLVTDQTRFGTVGDGLCNAVSEAVRGTREELYWERVTEGMRSSVIPGSRVAARKFG